MSKKPYEFITVGEGQHVIVPTKRYPLYDGVLIQDDRYVCTVEERSKKNAVDSWWKMAQEDPDDSPYRSRKDVEKEYGELKGKDQSGKTRTFVYFTYDDPKHTPPTIPISELLEQYEKLGKKTQDELIMLSHKGGKEAPVASAVMWLQKCPGIVEGLKTWQNTLDKYKKGPSDQLIEKLGPDGDIHDINPTNKPKGPSR